MVLEIESARLKLSQFQMSNAEEIFKCITPAITRFTAWDMPESWDKFKAWCEIREQTEETDLHLVIRRRDTMEFLGLAGLHGTADPSPELGIWIKEAAHGHGYGREAVRAVAEWASKALKRESFIYPVAVQNAPSRRIAEELNGQIVESCTTPKYDAVVYKIPALRP